MTTPYPAPDGEDRRDEGAAPEAARHLPQEQKQEDGGCGVPQDVDQVMSARAKPEELAVEHVGKSGERNPVASLSVREGPASRLDGQTFFDGRVLINIRGIIVIHEVEMRGLSKDGQNRQHEKSANASDLPRWRIAGVERRLEVYGFQKWTSASEGKASMPLTAADETRASMGGCWVKAGARATRFLRAAGGRRKAWWRKNVV
jgi:hypothetical protein